MAEADALAELQRLAPELHTLVLLGADGKVRASTLDDASTLAGAASELLDAAASLRPGGKRAVERLHIPTAAAAVFAIADEGRTLVAVADPDTAPALALHDLRTCLNGLRDNGGGADA